MPNDRQSWIDRSLRWLFGASAALGLTVWLIPGTGADVDTGAREILAVQTKVQSILDDLTERAANLATSVVRDSVLIRESFSQNPRQVAEAFRRLSVMALNREFSVQLSDARGQPLVWWGRTWGLDSSGRTESNKGGVNSRIDRVGPALILRVTATSATSGVFATTSSLLAVDEPSVARLFGVPEFARRFASEVGPGARLMPRTEGTASGSISLRSASNDSIASVQFDQGRAFGRTASANRFPSASVALAFMVAMVAVWVLLIRRLNDLPQWARVAVIPASFWLTRYLLLVLGIPQRLNLQELTDPTVYASTFGSGITASPLDLLLSTITLWYSIRWIALKSGGTVDVRTGLTSKSRRPWSVHATASMFLVLLPPLTRAYVVGIRSIVMDTTVPLYDMATVIPSIPFVTLATSALFLTISLREVWEAGLFWLRRSVALFIDGTGFVRWPLVAAALTISAALYGIADSSGVLTVPVLTVAGIVSVSGVLVRGERLSGVWWTLLVRLAGTLILALVVLDGQLHLRNKAEVEQFVEERLKPQDSWLTFLLTNDLRQFVDSGVESGTFAEGGRNSLHAFRLWSKTAMSRQSVNSGLLIYAPSGKEVDRFIVGLSSFEQQTALRAVFAGNEEVVQTLRLPSRGRDITMHGVWSTIRRGTEVIGSIAMILSPADDGASLLASGENVRSPSEWREVEYLGARVIRSNDPTMTVGSSLHDEVSGKLATSSRGSAWLPGGSTGEEVYYARDPVSPARVLAIHQEPTDVRWHLFHALKIAAVFALVGGLIRLPEIAGRIRARKFKISFRTRLFAGFTLVALVPLALLVVYNQQMSAERTRLNVERTLRRDLTLLHQRLTSLIETEEDIDAGLTDDFCASIAADLDIEFSFFRGIAVRASSRPELYASSVLDARLPAEVFTRIRMQGEDQVVSSQRIGPTTYAVGFAPLIVNGRTAGILAVPTLFRQDEIEEELSERNAFLLVAYALTMVIVLVVGGYLSGLIARPLSRLTASIRQVGRGRLPSAMHVRRSDEFGDVMNAFDEMVEELDQSRQKIARSEREQAWKEMAKQVAHEIKNPLTPMKLSVQHLRQAFKDRASDSESILEKVTGTILEQIETLSKIASEFSQFARLPERAFQRVDVWGIIREAAGLFRGVQGLQFAIDLPAIPAVAVADPDELRRVFVNLFRNSSQAMEDQGVVSIKGRVERGVAILDVSDTGPGVPENLKDRIFEPKFSTKTEGMGLGLGIVRGVLEDLGGSIRLLPSANGASFEIRVPIQEHRE